MDHAVGICDFTGQTRTECVAYEEMIGGCHVFITADWYLSEVMSLTVVQKWNFTVRLFVCTARLHLQWSTISICKSNRVCTHLRYNLSHHNLS